MLLQKIATFKSPFSSKFGIPKQSGVVENLPGQIVFEDKFRNADYIRGLEDFDYLWLIWGFSANPHEVSSPVVRPPRLGGNKRLGVFATRSPFRPNALGLSSVRIEKIVLDGKNAPVIYVKGADLMDGTPIYDIKPYVAYTDCHAGVRSGFVDTHEWKEVEVDFPESLRRCFTPDELNVVIQVLAQDPRPTYQHDLKKNYGMPIFGYDVRFYVEDGTLHVVDVVKK